MDATRIRCGIVARDELNRVTIYDRVQFSDVDALLISQAFADAILTSRGAYTFQELRKAWDGWTIQIWDCHPNDGLGYALKTLADDLVISAFAA